MEKSIPTIADLGYDGIEIAIYRPENLDVPSLKTLTTKYNLAVPVISTGQMYTMLDVWFTHPEREVRDRAVEVFRGIIDTAAEFGADVNVSRVRGSIHPEDTLEEGLKKLTGCLETLCSHAEKHGLSLLLEQMNRYETNYLNSAREVGEFVVRSGIPNLKIHADTFHMNIEDADVCGTLREYGEHLGYIHLADSNRLSPGSGHFDFRSVFDTLAEANYSRWFGVEVLTIPDSEQAARKAIDYLRSLENTV